MPPRRKAFALGASHSTSALFPDVAGSVLGCISYYRYASAGQFAPAGLVMLAALPIFVGFQLIIQAIVLDVQNVPRVPISPPL